MVSRHKYSGLVYQEEPTREIPEANQDTSQTKKSVIMAIHISFSVTVLLSS